MTQALVTLAAVLVGSRLALARYRHEKFWERKEMAYREVIEALHDRLEWVHAEFVALRTSTDLPVEEEQTIRKQLKASSANIRKARNCGSFLLRADVVTRLKRYADEEAAIPRDLDFTSYLVEVERNTESCLRDVISIGKSDLRVK